MHTPLLCCICMQLQSIPHLISIAQHPLISSLPTHLSATATRFLAIALLNKDGAVVKMSSTSRIQGLTVVYQVHREGVSSPISYVPLSEAWTDHLYYFGSIVFKKAGRYT